MDYLEDEPPWVTWLFEHSEGTTWSRYWDIIPVTPIAALQLQRWYDKPSPLPPGVTIWKKIKDSE